MKTGEALLLGGAALVLYNFYAKGTAAQGLYFYPAAVRNIRMEGGAPTMTLGIAVQNVSNQKMVLHAFAGNLIADGYNAGNISSFTRQEINPRSQTVLLVEVKLNPIAIVQEIIQIFQYSNFSMEIKLSAQANVDYQVVPVTLKYKIGA